jgi:hypothetical protein
VNGSPDYIRKKTKQKEQIFKIPLRPEIVLKRYLHSKFTLFTSVTFRKPEKSATTFPWVSIAPLGFPENRRQEGELVGSPVATP